MVKSLHKQNISLSREIAYIAVTCALLIGGQLALSAVAGVEIVTVVFAAFACVFGVRRGAILAVAFSLLRCAVFGFYPTAVILYLVYYPLLALVCGLLGKVKNFANPACAVSINALSALLSSACAALYFTGAVKVPKYYMDAVNVLLWVVISLSAAAAIAYDCVYFSKLKQKNDALKCALFCMAGAVMTVLFTLLDDVLTPLFFGYSKTSATAYFYASFTAMLPQTVCAAATISTMFLPLTALFYRVYGRN